MTKSTRHPLSACLDCGEMLDTATELDGEASPSPGDVTICLHCHHLMAYADDLTLRALTDDEMRDIAGDPRVLTAMKVLGAFKEFEKGVKSDQGKKG